MATKLVHQHEDILIQKNAMQNSQTFLQWWSVKKVNLLEYCAEVGVLRICASLEMWFLLKTFYTYSATFKKKINPF